MQFGPLTKMEADKALTDVRKQAEKVLTASTRIDTYRAIVDLELLAGDVKRFLSSGGSWADANEFAVAYDGE